ncbi:MAG: hypothetical protein KA465_01240 [Anaerolineaceae bacterium]|nr:hypothetical protein [Anaerolineaceae bacterium]
MKPKTVRQVTMYLCIITVLGFLSGCALSIVPKTEKPVETPLTLPARLEEPEQVPVVFNAELRRSYSDDTIIAIEVLDELSGLDRNINRYELTKVEENHYAGTLLLPRGEIIKYRYVSTFPISQPEAAADGSTVIYRSMTVLENTTIKDIIAGWPELPYEGDLGKLTGIISDQRTKQPLADILVTAAGYQTITDATGRFDFNQIPVGAHNISAISIDGAYISYQQEANIMANLSTPAVIAMTPLPEVNVTFIVRVPDQAIGAPVRLAGNLYQMGNVYADLSNGRSSLASRMPILSRLDDDKYSLQIKLHAGNALVYRYTLGDGYLNAERAKDGKLVTRRIIIPDHDVTIEDEIASWGVAGVEPITIKVTVPAETPAEDSIFIQLQQGTWQQPLPMWPMGNNQWMILLFLNPEARQNTQYRICRNAECDLAYDEASYATPIALADITANTSLHTVSNWHAWQPQLGSTQDSFRFGNDTELIGVEFINDYQPSDLNRYRDSLQELKQSGFNWVVFTPTWKVGISNNLPQLSPNLSQSMLMMDLADLVQLAKESGFTVGLYPRLDFSMDSAEWWQNSKRDALWWQQWYQEYERFVISYTQFAANTKVDQLILGGVDISASLPGGVETTIDNKGTPKNADQLWEALLQKVNQYYPGRLLWALPVGESELPKYTFYDQIDGFYLQFQPPADNYSGYDPQTVDSTLNNIAANFQRSLDDKQYFAGLNAPALSADDFTCPSADCLISPRASAYNAYPANLDTQLNFYRTYLSALSQRSWVQGTSSRGFFPVVKLHDFSSSIYGKPAMQLLSNSITDAD